MQFYNDNKKKLRFKFNWKNGIQNYQIWKVWICRLIILKLQHKKNSYCSGHRKLFYQDVISLLLMNDYLDISDK